MVPLQDSGLNSSLMMSAQQEELVKIKRVKGQKISVPIIIGSMAQKMRQNVNMSGHNFPLTHKWCAYVRGLRETNNPYDPMEEQDLSFLIKKVEF